MTVSALSPSAIMADTVSLARRVALPTLPGLLLYAAAIGGQSYVNALAAGGGQMVFYWMLAGLLTIFVGAFWSADMYRKLLPEADTRSVMGDAARLWLANLAVYGLYFLIGFLLTLFFSIFTGILLGSAGYDPSGAAPDDIWESIRVLNLSGGAAVLYLLLFVTAAGLVWLGIRLFLFGVATIAERRLTIFRSWPWTSGHAARIALLWVFLQLAPWLILTLLATGLLHLAGLQTVFSLLAGVQAPAAGAPGWLVPAMAAAGTLVMAPFYWLGHGLAVALYQRLAPNRVDAETTFG